jgi:hypothetical protein
VPVRTAFRQEENTVPSADEAVHYFGLRKSEIVPFCAGPFEVIVMLRYELIIRCRALPKRDIPGDAASFSVQFC